MFIRIFFAMFFIVITSVLKAETYTVVKRETLGKILDDKKLNPIWGKHGNLIKTLLMNPGLKIGDGDRIFPGQIINLPELPLNPSRMISNFPVVQDAQVPLVPDVPETQAESVVLESKICHWPKHNLSASVSDRFLRLNSKDKLTGATSSLISSAGAGVFVSWSQQWSEDISTFIGLDTYNVSINNSENSSKELKNVHQRLTHFIIGMDRKLNNKVDFSLMLKQGESLVTEATSVNVLTIDKFQSTKISPGVSLSLYELGNTKLICNLNYISVLPATQGNFHGKLSHGYQAGVGLEAVLRKFGLRSEVFFENIDYKMKDVSFTQTELGIKLDLSFEIE